jgi:hypothetical protein
MISEMIAKVIPLGIGFLHRICEVLRTAPHLFELLGFGQEDFQEAEQDITGGIRRALSRVVTVLTEAKASQFTSVDFSKNSGVIGSRDFAGVRPG